MFIIKRIVVIISAIIGACLGMVLLALLNTAFHFNLSLSQVSLYGIFGGLLTGIFGGYYFIYLIVKRAKRFIGQKAAGLFSKFTGPGQKIKF